MNLYMPEIRVDAGEHQLDQHGDAVFPAAFYGGDLSMSVPWHWHDELELILAHQGTFSVGAGAVITAISEGDACFINAGALHSVWKISNGPVIYHSVVFHPRLIGSLDSVFWLKYVSPLTEPSFPHFIHFRKEIPEEKAIIDMLTRAWTSAAEEVEMYENEARYQLTRLLDRLGKLSEGMPQPLSRQEIRDMERMKVMLGWIEEHYAEDVAVSQIAAACGISESECLRCFKRNVGRSPVQYLIEYRLRHAAEMLLTDSLNVSEIAAACGFLDMSYFSRIFKAAYHCSPTTYRATANLPEKTLNRT